MGIVLFFTWIISHCLVKLVGKERNTSYGFSINSVMGSYIEYTIAHKPGLENCYADALSRLPEEVNMKDPRTPPENVFLMEFLNSTPDKCTKHKTVDINRQGFGKSVKICL
jgi:hypothetical protein